MAIKVKKRWYVTCSPFACQPTKKDAVWTISRYPKVEGWETDCGYCGYGLTWKAATELADAANSAWETK